ncbi:MAG: hypothetical protein B7Z66_07150 [Chromatiales bacterium 21-64-14]|nr:MAG: hypothetical protein B7Z66_07150 [Chromatiales bacterium 21-64-14]HQU16595.1 hypothetical protein [Gammaproteobacteria bacterium]
MARHNTHRSEDSPSAFVAGTAAQPVSYAVGEHWLSGLDLHVYLDGRPVALASGRLVGALQLGSMLIVAAGGELVLLTLDGEPVERLTQAQGVPAGLETIGVDGRGGVWLRTPTGVYRGNLEGAG